MSLFPAYDPSTSKANCDSLKDNSSSHTHEAITCNSDLSWLTNTSYSVEEKRLNHEVENSYKKGNDTPSKPEDKKHKKGNTTNNRKSERSEKCSRKTTVIPRLHKSSSASSKSIEDEHFYEDKKQEKGNFLVDTLYRPAIPRYDKHSQYFKVYKLLKKKLKKHKKPKRYYSTHLIKNGSSFDSSEDSFSKEGELSKITEEFNKKLAENPKDVDTWLDYIAFQNTVLDFEKTYRSSSQGGTRVTSERQLAILERALQSNPANPKLLTMKLHILEHTLSPDQVADDCSRALIQDPGCIPLWQALIRTSRNNMARCVVPAVLQQFSKALSRLGQLRVHRPPATIDKDILNLMMECGLFLQQAGLWEQLMVLLQMYLGLNLTASGQFTLPAEQHDVKIREQEDSILSSGLPLSVLWLRIEKLRAAYHFLPSTENEADPQRIVLPEDLGGLLQPVMSGELRLQLVAVAFHLLKIPFLPTRHTTLECVGLLQVPSAISNVETLLAAAFPSGLSSSSSNCMYLAGSMELICEPQFVKETSGQPEFLSTVTSLLRQCADLLPAADAVLVNAWLLRMYAWLCRLHYLRLGAVPAAVVKQAKSLAKHLLKQPQFRDNLQLYTEYAMVERASGELDRACQVLETASALPSLPGQQQQCSNVHLLLLRRRLAESLLLKDYTANKELAVKVLMPPQPGDITALVEQWRPTACEPLTLAAALSPQLLVESLACHSLYLCLTQSVWDATALLQQYIDSIPHSGCTLGSAWVEQLYEVMTDLLYLHTTCTKSGYAVLRSSLIKALKLFPNNLSLLNTMAGLESGSGGSPVWKLVSYFPSSVPLARLVLVFVVRHRTSTHQSNNGAYLRNLLRQLTSEEGSGQCPLVWRLYLQLAAAQEAGEPVKATFYKALQACPWFKALYLDAVKFLPEELPEVQDLLIEKELRLYTTPEELEILRE